jgi:hypothetical protein
MQWFDGRLKGRSFRVVHSADIVARVPWLLRMFRHAGTEIFYDAAGRMHVEMPWYRKMASDALGLWREWQRGRVALLADHHVESYVKLVGGEQWKVESSHGSTSADAEAMADKEYRATEKGIAKSSHGSTESRPAESCPTESCPTESCPTESRPTESRPTESRPTIF